MQTNLWTFQDDITKSLNVEQYIQSEFDELEPRNIHTSKGSATIKDISIEQSTKNENNQLIIKIAHKGKIYISKNKITKQNIEYLFGITNVKEFKIDEIIGSKIKFNHINENSLLIKNKLSYSFAIPLFLMYFICIFFVNVFFIQIVNIYSIITCIAIAGYVSYTDLQDINNKKKNIFEFTPQN